MTSDRPLRRDAELNRQRIIEAAREVFAERGLAATLEDVAQRAGVGIGTVYRRFPNKDALLEVALHERMEDCVREAELALQAETGWAGLTTFLRRSAEMHAADRGLRDLALGADLGRCDLDPIRERVVPLLQRLIDRARDEGALRPDVTAEDLPILLMMVSEVAHHSHPIRPDAYGRYLTLLIDGLRAGPNRGDLGKALTHDEVETLAQQWLPGTPPPR